MEYILEREAMLDLKNSVSAFSVNLTGKIKVIILPQVMKLLVEGRGMFSF